MIIITMAGKSSRFQREGYENPKFMLPIWELTVFDYVLLSFKRYFEIEFFVFVVQEEHECVTFVETHASSLGIKAFKIVVLSDYTRGQAETVKFALDRLSPSNYESLLIFNVDTFRPNFELPNLENTFGWLETFNAEGSNWSFILPSVTEPNTVIKVAEKERISNYCSTGAYWFIDSKTFLGIFDNYKEANSNMSELFIAPMFNFLIESKKIVRYSSVDSESVLPCGVPSEYESLISKQPSLF